jgi:hypothetical protein
MYSTPAYSGGAESVMDEKLGRDRFSELRAHRLVTKRRIKICSYKAAAAMASCGEEKERKGGREAVQRMARG